MDMCAGFSNGRIYESLLSVPLVEDTSTTAVGGAGRLSTPTAARRKQFFLRAYVVKESNTCKNQYPPV